MDYNQEYHNRTIIIGKKHTGNNKETEKKLTTQGPNKTGTSTNSLKVERDFEEGKALKTWGIEYGKAITVARCKLVPKTNQAALAKKLNVKPEVVRDIENGKGMYNAQLGNKLFRLLKVKRNT